MWNIKEDQEVNVDNCIHFQMYSEFLPEQWVSQGGKNCNLLHLFYDKTDWRKTNDLELLSAIWYFVVGLVSVDKYKL